MVLGTFPQDLHGTGENDYERHIRRAYAAPDPPQKELETRLRSFSQVLTVLKMEELLLELPSKRLLLKFVEQALGVDHACLASGSSENHLFGGAFGAPDFDASRSALVPRGAGHGCLLQRGWCSPSTTLYVRPER